MRVELIQNSRRADSWFVRLVQGLWTAVYVWNKGNKEKNPTLITCVNMPKRDAEIAAMAAVRQYRLEGYEVIRAPISMLEGSLWHLCEKAGCFK